MMIIRSIEEKDADALFDIAKATGPGMTSIPKDRRALENRLADPDLLLFVLEDLETKNLGGICGILKKTGELAPSCFYLKESQGKFEVLHPTYLTDGPSEICSLYLLPEYRKEGLGKLLSFSRFLYVSAFPETFTKTLFAELRGYIDKNGNSPFWDALGYPFMNLSFDQVNRLLDGSKNSFPESLPRYPVYTFMLPKKAQTAVGKTHPNTKAALKLLEKQGFSKTDLINTLDAGPVVEAKVEDIKTVKEALVAKVCGIEPAVTSGKQQIITNNTLNFRACYGRVKKKKSQGVIIEEGVAKALQVEIGSLLRFSPTN